jgi:hypothetical protein
VSDPSSDSPNDRKKKKWPLWRILLAYAILLAIAFTSIWVIDRRVDALAEPGSSPASANGPQVAR